MQTTLTLRNTGKMPTSEQDLFLLNFPSECSAFVSVYDSEAWFVKYSCRVVLGRVPFWSINRLMNKHNCESPISFIKITDRM